MLNSNAHSPALPSIRVVAAIATMAVLGAQTRAAPQAREERGIYEAVIKMLVRGDLPSKLVIRTPHLVFPVPSTIELGPLGPASGTLQTKVQAARPSQAESINVESFPAGTQFVAKEEIDEIFRTAPRGNSPDSRWIPFRERFNATSYQAFSRPIVTDDGLDALVYYQHACGSLCGESGYVWLHRSSTADAWMVARRLVKSVS